MTLANTAGTIISSVNVAWATSNDVFAVTLVSSIKHFINSDVEFYLKAGFLSHRSLWLDLLLLPQMREIFPGFKVMTALLDPGGEDLQYSALKFLLQHTDPLAQNSINQNRQACKTEFLDQN